jgi:hypothetical protein
MRHLLFLKTAEPIAAEKHRLEHVVECIGLTHKTEIRGMGAVGRRQVITIIPRKSVPGQGVNVLDALRLPSPAAAFLVLSAAAARAWGVSGYFGL